MELAIQIQVEQLPEGPYLATSGELPGLVAQGRTAAEALEIARDVARRLIEVRREREGMRTLPTTMERRDYTIVVAVNGAACRLSVPRNSSQTKGMWV
jgi:predicted RNase H-like HicB family nuclease